MEERVYGSPENDLLRGITTDGRTGVIMTNNARARTGWDVLILDLTNGKVQPFVATPFLEVLPVISADGRWVAYASNESGRMEVYVQSRGEAGGKWQISTDGGVLPLWINGDREILFATADGKLMAVDVSLAPEFTAGVTQPLFETKRRQMVGQQISASSDGALIAVNRPLEQPVTSPMTLVQNWPAALEQ